MKTNLPTIIVATSFQSNMTKFNDPVKYPQDTITPLRFTTSYELEIFLTDGGTIFLNNQRYRRRKGSLLLALPNDKRQSSLHYESVIIRFDVTDPAIRELIYSIRGFHTAVDFDKFYNAFMEICNEVTEFKTDSDLQAGARLVVLLCDLKQALVRDEAGLQEQYPSAVGLAIEYMKSHYREKISVNNIAEYCYLSNSHFHKVFTETIHMTPNNYLTNLRLTHAKLLLSTTGISISEIASKSGFSSSTYFGECFRKHFNMTPKEFRNSLLANSGQHT